MVVAHGYVQFGANMGLVLSAEADWTPIGKFSGIASNWIKGYFNVQVGIRTFIKVVLPHLLANENCQEAHLMDSEDNPIKINIKITVRLEMTCGRGSHLYVCTPASTIGATSKRFYKLLIETMDNNNNEKEQVD